MEGSPFRNVVQPNNPAMMFLETGLESPLMIDESQPGFSKLARGRAETISYTQTRPFLTDEEASVLNVRELPMRRNMNSAMRHTRNRSETFSGGTANSVLMDPFSPSAFTSGWGDAVRSPTLTNRPMSAQIDPYPVRFGSPSLLTSGFTTNQIHASTVDTVTRTLDYLSLDDGAFDALSRNDPVAHAFHMAGTQRSNGTAQNRGRSMTSALNPGAINTIPFSPATTTMRPRSFTIPARPVYQSSYENENVDFYGATTQSPMMQEVSPYGT